MQIATATSNALEHYLSLASQQLKLTAGNMANVDTPGFKTLGFDFDSEMRRAMTAVPSVTDGEESGEAVASLPGDYASPNPGRVDGLISRPDGNNVSLDREGMKMAEAQLKFRTGVALLKQDFSQIADAIHADAK